MKINKSTLIIACVSLLALGALWIAEQRHQRRVFPEVPERWLGSYRTPKAWEREMDESIKVYIHGEFMKVERSVAGEVMKPKFIKVKSCTDYPTRAVVEMPDENRAILAHDETPGFFEFEYQDITFAGEMPSGREVYEDFGMKPVPLEKLR